MKRKITVFSFGHVITPALKVSLVERNAPHCLFLDHPKIIFSAYVFKMLALSTHGNNGWQGRERLCSWQMMRVRYD